MKARVYLPREILDLVRQDAAARLGVRKQRVIVKATNLGPINVNVLEEGKPLGPFFIYGSSRVVVADRVEGGDVVLECPFDQRGAYPVRVTVAKFRTMKAAQLRKVHSEFVRMVVPFPPKGWEKLCGISPRIAIEILLAAAGKDPR